MPGPLAIVLPLVLAGVLIASAFAKLRTPDDLAGWTEMGVPRPLRRPWLLAVHPWAELALGLALAVLGGVLGLLAALVAVALMAAYLWMVVAVHRRAQGTSCACFGARTPVTGVTIARNAWLLLLAVITTTVVWTTPLVGGAVAAAADGSGWLWLVGAAVAAATVALILWPVAASPVVAAPAQPLTVGEDGEDEYVRLRTPAVPVTLADGTTMNLRRLAAKRPMLLMAVSETCGGCEPVIERVPEWRTLLPEVDIRLLIARPPGDSTLTETSEPQSLHDPHGYVSGSIEDWPTPTAVLLGIDGLLAGGPEIGYLKIADFVADIRATLDEQLAAVAQVAE
jgi:hypothetical protein